MCKKCVLVATNAIYPFTNVHCLYLPLNFVSLVFFVGHYALVKYVEPERKDRANLMDQSTFHRCLGKFQAFLGIGSGIQQQV